MRGIRRGLARVLASALTSGVLLASAGPALADMPVTYQEHGKALFSLDTPDYWTARSGGPRLIAPPGSEDFRETHRIIGFQPTAQPDAWVGFVAPAGVQTFSDARDYLREIGPFLLTNAKAGEEQSTRIGGRPAIIFKGTGQRNGKNLGFTAMAIDLPGNRIAVGVAVVKPDVDPAILAATNRLISSFRPAN